MASLFEIGKSGVQAYRQALSVTGQNIANINTEGYNKRSADVTEIAGASGGATNVADQSGLGVRVDNIRRSFDAFLADNTRSSTSEYEKLNDFVTKISNLENMLLPTDSNLGTYIGRFFDSLQDVASNPDNISARIVSLETGKALASSFNSYDRQLESFKSSSLKQLDTQIIEANSTLVQLGKVNSLILRSGSKAASNDILDARDQLLVNLSKNLNFTVDYNSSGSVNVRMGESGNGPLLLEKANVSTLTATSDNNKISLNINKSGIKTSGDYITSGIISGITQFYNLVQDTIKDIGNLAEKVTQDMNEIQMSGIDLNGNMGKSMFSINSMSPVADNKNKSLLTFNLIEGNPNQIKQERVIVKYSKSENNWEVSNSSGISKVYGNKINLTGYQVEILGTPQDGDSFIISPSKSKSASMRFNLINPEDFAAASKNLISNNSKNIGNVDLKLLGTVQTKEVNFPSKIEDVFTSSTNPLVATTFLKDGPVTTIPSTINSLNLSSLGNQSSASFTIADAEVKGFSSFKITLANNNVVEISAATTDPGDGIKSVKELADILNSGLMLDGKSQHNFKKHGLFATGSNGYLTIASSLSDIKSSSVLSRGNSFSPSISNISASAALPSNIQVFTRDGRHVSGTSLNTTEIASLIKKENGFLDDAEYRNDYLNNNYRGMSLTRQTASGDFVKNFGSSISYNEQSTDMDALFLSNNLTTGALTLDGMQKFSSDLDAYITFACANDESSKTFTISGYDLDGLYQTETLTGGNITTVTSTKIFSEVSSISINGNSTGKVAIGTEAVGYSLKLQNNDNVSSTTTVPVGSSAYYLANKLKTELAGTGVKVSASTKLLIGPFLDGTSGAITFDLKGKNTEAVSINTSIAASDITALAKEINQYTSQTGLTAVINSDFKKIIIESKDGYDINLKNVTAPSDFYLETLSDDFTSLDKKILIDISDTKKVSAHIKGELKFVSSETFSTQINSGVVMSSSSNSLVNGYLDIDRSASGEKITIKPEVFNELDNSLGSPDGKKASVGVSKYGLDINQKNYKMYIKDGNSLYKSANPGGAGTLTLDGQLKDANNLNAVVNVYCSASETSNIFTVTGTDLSGTTINEQITGGSSGVRVFGSTVFQTISSITTSVTASGNIKVGTVGYNNINDDDGLVQSSSFSSGSITLDGPLSSADYLGAKIKITSTQDTTGTSFVIAGVDLNGEVLTETITGSNGGTVTTSGVFKTITSINSSGTSNGNIEIGTVGADGNWSTSIDANALNIDSEEEISTAILSSLRVGTPTSQLKGIVLNSLPIDGQSVELGFEGQTYKLKMVSGELIVEGPESNRIKARFNGTSENINNSISTLQAGTASTALLVNGLNSVVADSDGLVDVETRGTAGNFTIDGAQSTLASSNLSSTIIISSANDNNTVIFTITGTDVDGNAQTETITGVNANSVRGTKLFKTVSQIASDAGASAIDVGTTSAFASTSGTRVSITSVGNESENVFTITGTGTDGLSKTETVFGPLNGKTVSSIGLYKTITSITPSKNTSGNIEIGTAPGFELRATAEGTIEGAQFKIIQSSVNSTSASSFGLIKGTTTLLGNYVVQPTPGSGSVRGTPAMGITVTEGEVKTDYSIVFNSSNVPTFYNAQASAVSGSPPSGITLSWSETSGVTDDDALYLGTASTGVAIVPNGILTTTDDDSLFISKTLVAGNLLLDGPLKSSKALNGTISIYCAGDERTNSFTVSGYDINGNYVTEAIIGVNGATASGTTSFKEVISISANSNSASTIKVGTTATSVAIEPSVITIVSDGASPLNRFTIVGLDQFGKTQTEVIEENVSGTVIGEKVFTKINSITPSMDSASGGTATFKVGTKSVGRLSISHTIDALSFKIESNPNINNMYGIKTQDLRAIVDKNGLSITSLSGNSVKVDVPNNSIQNSVAEKISLENIPSEDFITFVTGNGARKISAEYDIKPINDNIKDLNDPELTITVDSSNKNKVEIFDKKSGHSIASRILDSNRVFEINGSTFQFSEDPLINNSFEFSTNSGGLGDNRNLINMLNLQNSDSLGGQKGNFQEIFSNTVAKVGSNVQANKMSLSSASSNLDAAQAGQSELAGVNLDEEAANLLEFQQAYQASARILQTARELFQSLLDVV
ncbi:flagellar hook-associated protein FlgK [Alphaproteobacteria bacterium]|nr:flagellar hook-associated protein FlgK [Alphaproteobacteria bacterium]